MKSEIKKNGLYYLLNTPEVQRRLQELGVEKRAVFTKGDSAQISKLIAREISHEIEGFLRDKIDLVGTEEKKSNPHWIADLLESFPESATLKTAAADSLPLDDQILAEIKLIEKAAPSVRPTTELVDSALIVPDGQSPQLGNEVARELESCDCADWLVSFIKLTGIRGFLPELRQLCNMPRLGDAPRLRIATTTYMGATDIKALEELFKLPNTEIKVCFNTSSTRLHAKAYLFRRASGFGSAYVGSANLSSVAMGTGMEWTVKVAQIEMPRLWNRARLAFETCWNDPNFETCTAADLPRIQEALDVSRFELRPAASSQHSDLDASVFTFRPHTYQTAMLNQIAAEREEGKTRHLIVSATGTGKTIVAAFDYAQMQAKLRSAPTLLFLAHRTDIVQQACEKYRAVMKSPEFGYVVGDYLPQGRIVRQCFCTVQSWRNHVRDQYGAAFFDMLVLDECHHAQAGTYQEIFDFYQEAIDGGKTDLLGLTATPFRSDGRDIRPDFGGEFTHELSLAEAIEHGHIVPFTYFGIDDEVDYTTVDWEAGGSNAQIQEILANNARQLDNVYRNLYDYVAEPQDLRALGFCAGVAHARRACDYMNAQGIKSRVLSAQSSEEERQQAIRDMEEIPPRLNIIFTADLFNEGVDIPCVNTALMLRPTNSPLIFVQQLGRGLRHAPPQYGKSDLLVLDFVGNHNAQYKGHLRFQLMSTRGDVPIKDQIESGMPFLPAGCSVTLTDKCRKKVLKNIEEHMRSLRGQTLRRHLVETIRAAGKHIPLTGLMEEIASSSPAPVYQVGNPAILEAEAFENQERDANPFGKNFHAMGQNDSPAILDTWMKILRGKTDGIDPDYLKMSRFFLTSLFDAKATMETEEEAWIRLSRQKGLLRDLQEFIEWRRQRIVPMKQVVFPKTSSLLELHRAYTSKQISAALGRNGSVIMSGTDYNKKKNLDSFFITRIKSDKDFSPTTMYDDFAEAPAIFHWESPSSTTIRSAQGQRYINGTSTKMLFIRQKKSKKTDITGHYPISSITSSYIFLGPVKRVLDYEGERPIAFDFELEHPMPADVYVFARGA